jgi:hypothetical protein
MRRFTVDFGGQRLENQHPGEPALEDGERVGVAALLHDGECEELAVDAERCRAFRTEHDGGGLAGEQHPAVARERLAEHPHLARFRRELERQNVAKQVAGELGLEFEAHGRFGARPGEIRGPDQLGHTVHAARHALEEEQCVEKRGLPRSVAADEERGALVEPQLEAFEAAVVVDVELSEHGSACPRCTVERQRVA